MNNKVFQNCKYCVYVDTCQQYIDCEYLHTFDKNKYDNSLSVRLRKISRSTYGRGQRSMSEDNKKIIRDYIDDLQSGLCVWVYSESVVIDILRLEPFLKIVYKNDMYYICL